ncbi:MAG: 50S ribosomal protein L35 [Phycisphaerae bacterium]
MPKMKTNKSVRKRIKITATGKMLRKASGTGHLRSRKTPKRLRSFRKARTVSKGFQRQARRMLGIG